MSPREMEYKQRICELEARVLFLEIMLQEARVLAEAEKRAADALEARLAVYIMGEMRFAAAHA